MAEFPPGIVLDAGRAKVTIKVKQIESGLGDPRVLLDVPGLGERWAVVGDDLVVDFAIPPVLL